MASNLWFFYALGASVFWGLGYVLSEKILKTTSISPAFFIMITEMITLPIWVFVVWKIGHFKTGFEALYSNFTVLVLVFISALTVVGGCYLIFQSILEKNATMASLVEISYPLFTALFAYIVLKEVQLSWSAAAGGLLIFSGIIVIYLKG